KAHASCPDVKARAAKKPYGFMLRTLRTDQDRPAFVVAVSSPEVEATAHARGEAKVGVKIGEPFPGWMGTGPLIDQVAPPSCVPYTNRPPASLLLKEAAITPSREPKNLGRPSSTAGPCGASWNERGGAGRSTRCQLVPPSRVRYSVWMGRSVIESSAMSCSRTAHPLVGDVNVMAWTMSPLSSVGPALHVAPPSEVTRSGAGLTGRRIHPCRRSANPSSGASGWPGPAA